MTIRARINRIILKTSVLATMLAGTLTEANALDCDTIREDDTACLACNIYHEARNQSVKGQVAVAQVTKNRLFSENFPNSFCEVVWQNAQFSWTKDGKSDKVYEQKPWALAYRIAQAITESKTTPDMTDGAIHYHTTAINPLWNRGMEITTIVQDHIFYRYAKVSTTD